MAGMLTLPLCLMLLLMIAVSSWVEAPAVQGALRGLGAVAAGLIAGTGLKMIRPLRGNPLGGLVTLTIVVALSFVASGIAKLVVGWSLRSVGLGGWVMASGLLSVILGVMFMGNILGAAPWVLGFLLGIELISDGVAALFLWHSGEKA